MTELFKGIAVLMVILVHSHQRYGLTYSQSAIQRFGQMGCQIFFVLSSFGLCYSFSKEVPKWSSHMKKRLSGLAVGWWGAILINALYRVAMAIFSQKDIVENVNIPGVIINALFLNGFVPVNGINNTVVRGGWYIGTTVILYAIFPLLYKIYFSDKNASLKKYRAVLFPTVIFLITAVVVIVSERIHPLFICSNNSFVYFSFINQLTPFSLGIVFFDICNSDKKSKYAPLISIVLWIASIFLFYCGWRYSFVFCQSFVACAFVFIGWWLFNNERVCDVINKNKNCVLRALNSFGKISFPIYLTHQFVVYDFSVVCLKFLRPLCNNDFLWYIILLPIEIVLVYFVGSVYNKCILGIKNFKKAK